MRIIPFSLLLAFAGLFSLPMKAENPRSILDQWIESRRLLSEERAAWKEEKESLRQAIELLETEKSFLNDAIDRERLRSDGAAEEDERMGFRTEAFRTLSASSEKHIERAETELREISGYFPGPLKEQIRPLRRSLESPPSSSSLIERLANILGILLETDAFDKAVTVHRELLTTDDGTQVEMDVLYVGLAHAYYVDRNGTRAGTGQPGPDGWTWTPDRHLAPKVRRAVSMIESGEKPVFISLPAGLLPR